LKRQAPQIIRGRRRSLGSFIDRAFDGTMLPLAVGFAGYGLNGT
jgi:hypothetical protein